MKRLHWYDFISLNLFWLGLNIRNNAVGTLFTPYLVVAFVSADYKNTALGLMNTAGLVIAMLVQPAAGLLSDRSTSRFGRRRPFIFVGVLLDLLFLAAIALSWNYTSLLIATLLMQFSANISHGPLQGLIPDQVPEEQRGMASGFKAVMELLPLILIAFTIAKLVGIGQFGWAVVATGVALLITMLLTMVLVKEEPLIQKPATPLGPEMVRVLGVLAGILLGGAAGLVAGGAVGGLVGWLVWLFSGAAWGGAPAGVTNLSYEIAIGLGGMVAMAVAVVAGVWAGASATLGKGAREQSAFTWWVVNRLFFLAAVTSIQKFAPFFLMYAFDITREAAAEQTGMLMMVVGLFTLAAAIPGGWLSDRLGHARLVGLSGLLGALGAFLLLGAIWKPSMSIIYLAGVILGLAAGLFTATNWAMGTTLAPKTEAGRYLGISNLAGAGAGMIGTGIGGVVADYLDSFQPGLGYFTLFSCYGVLFILSTLTLRKIGPRG